MTSGRRCALQAIMRAKTALQQPRKSHFFRSALRRLGRIRQAKAAGGLSVCCRCAVAIAPNGSISAPSRVGDMAGRLLLYR
jgi:hypothetical protein